MSELDRRTFLKLGAVGLGAVALGSSAKEAAADSPQSTPEPEIPQRDPYAELVGLMPDNGSTSTKRFLEFENDGTRVELRHSTYENDHASIRVRVMTPGPDGHRRFAGGFSVDQDSMINMAFVFHREVFPGMDTREISLFPNTPERQKTSFQNAIVLADFVHANLPQK